MMYEIRGLCLKFVKQDVNIEMSHDYESCVSVTFQDFGR